MNYLKLLNLAQNVKNFNHSFPESEINVFRRHVLSDQQSRALRYSVYKNIKLRNAANPQIGEAKILFFFCLKNDDTLIENSRSFIC